MASTSYTENLGLCAWQATDRPKRVDFVNDNSIIDEKLGGHLKNTYIHVTSEEKEKLNNPYTVFTYAGDGAASKTFALSDTYTFAIVFQKFYPPIEVKSGNTVVSHCAVVGRLFGSSANITLKSDSIVVTQDTTATDNVINNFNENGGQYVILLFK